MSKPHPVALTAAMLMERTMDFAFGQGNMDFAASVHQCADLASRLHRLSKGCLRASVAECNGEMWDGQRDAVRTQIACMDPAVLTNRYSLIEEDVAKYCARIDKQVAKLSAELAPFGLTCKRNRDGRGFPLKLYGEGIPHNDMGGDCWGIEA